MEVPFLDLKRQYNKLKPLLDQAVIDVIEEQYFVRGKRVDSFEQDFASVKTINHCVGVGNGTDALFIVLKMLGIGSGDEVIIPAHGWLSAAEMIKLTGATPVFVDVCKDSFCMNADLVEQRISKKTKAIIPIHLYGQMADMKRLGQIAESHNLHLIEDCAQAHFASQNGQPSGSLGIAGTFSFYPSKLLGAFGDAGCIATHNLELASNCKAYANHGELTKNEHQFLGINSRLDSLQAAVLSIKLKHVNACIAGRNKVASHYSEGLKNLSAIQTPKIMEGNTHDFHLYVIRCERRNELKEFLSSKGISTAVHYPNATPYTKAFFGHNYQPEDFPVSHQLQGEVLSLPMFAKLKDEELDYVVEQIQMFYS
jgi:dTDP-4-amino-4,6-dideoxygalactose transaminase